MGENEKKVESVENVKADKTAKKDKPVKAKSDKPSVWRRLGKFLKDCKSELKKIVWFSKEQTIKSTAVVIVVLVVCSAVISGLDVGFSKLVNWLATLA